MARYISSFLKIGQSGDYEDFSYCDLELFNELRPKAEEFIIKISSLIANQG